MYMSQNVVDLVDFGILSERRLENLNICMSQNMVDLVDFVFHSQRRLEISNICMSQNVVDLVDFVFHLSAHNHRKIPLLTLYPIIYGLQVKADSITVRFSLYCRARTITAYNLQYRTTTQGFDLDQIPSLH